jgi:hypothetical protein
MSSIRATTAATLLRNVRGIKELDRRMRALADTFVDYPYIVDPLGGAHTTRERLVTRLDGFDCVTFVETVWALSLCATARDFPRLLRTLRYQESRVAWDKRLHYFHDFLTTHIKAKRLFPPPRGAKARSYRKRLSLVSALPAKDALIHVIPKSLITKQTRLLGRVAIAAFASHREGLDYYHVGLVFTRDPFGKREPEPMLIHASRSRGKVVCEPLRQFLKQQQTRGVTLTRPRAQEVCL